MKSSIIAAASAASGLVAADNVPTVHFPLTLLYGNNEKIHTTLTKPETNTTIPVVYDSGSENFFVFGPGAIDNWGSSNIGVRGQCNASVPESDLFDYKLSTTASQPVDHPATYIYGGADKIYGGSVTINDTFIFVNDDGLSYTLENTRVELVDFLTQRIRDTTCSYAPLYDLGILGVSPFYQGAGRNTTGPSVRQDLLDRGIIGASVQSMWFDEAPEDPLAPYTGNGLIGGIDTSKYSGDLVKVKTVVPGGANVGYFTEMPTVSINGHTFTQTDSVTYCQLDSGTHDDTIPIAYAENDLFENITGIITSPIGYTSWNGTCDTIPTNITVDLTFPGVVDGTSVTVKTPLRAYARVDYGEPGYCAMSVGVSGCFLGSPFHSAAFFAADDEHGEIALAQGGVSKPGSSFDPASVVGRIP
ncbi:uncharacterized protein JN550_012796 [Neoarthrinium moseri]|uniref:uncharacterized protein n=1 Tax=Neoarthrinium moseri TaxID=1658444 RepID=UPI001FDDDD7A|nr:uncharacterized protein JN550_012796 [Neoarthrinium moseri]KAI1858265.1 hypothetical protein JN550_012796 [Neoarthrinium moseri]